MSEFDPARDDDSLLGALGDALRDASPDDAPPAPDYCEYLDPEILDGRPRTTRTRIHSRRSLAN